jgi:hypothetical protein
VTLPAHATLLKAVVAFAIVGLAGGPVAPGTRGLLVDQASSTGSFTTDTLDPPTGLGAVGGLNAQLTWTITPDTYASGYEILRSTVSGGGYALVATATPRTVASHTDTPVPNTYYYVLRSYFSNWTSAQTAEVFAVVVLGGANTGFVPCTAQAAEAGGDNNGYEVNPANGCVDDGAFAADVNSGTNVNLTCTNAGKDKHRFTTFGIPLPGTVTSIDGISIRVKAGVDATAGTNRICAQLSWNNGVTYTAAQNVDITSTTLTTYTMGGPAFLWGRVWAVGNFSNANFRVRLMDVSSVATRDFRLDAVQVQVNYTP